MSIKVSMEVAARNFSITLPERCDPEYFDTETFAYAIANAIRAIDPPRMEVIFAGMILHLAEKSEWGESPCLDGAGEAAEQMLEAAEKLKTLWDAHDARFNLGAANAHSSN